MKVFDVHSDILYDLYYQYKKGNLNRFKKTHLSQMNNSIIEGALWTMFSPDDFDLLEAVKISLEMIDWDKISNYKVMLGLEGLRNLKEAEDIRKLYDLGFRHAMLTWNEENKYATGVAGDSNSGVKEEGYKLLKIMEELDMIIDVAHLNQKSFYDVLEFTNKNIIYSHGLVKEICDHRRNLTLNQMKVLKEANGLFGLTLAKSFVSKDEDKRGLEYFLNHVDYAVSVMGIDNVCFGFDFMDYLSDFENANVSEVPDATKVHLIIEGMEKRGYSKEDIKKISWDNFYNRFKNKLFFKGE
ncbi:MAG: membrane dipeptidase [Bacilli bacterium]|jgi:membrane dipeptidase|nr:membrane dipeptidase [Bacilli bacterium]MDD2681527.1 membrane dipeptidase [Bacilli bacterium]MDD3121060.1 membrane dipeptidase [Bacilli bacterium]MDD4063234.1 membrane dipeptidase [Bacilli bacterium]MDD4481874.1 membrane dipeptidase [Bacilli bacterium]